MNIAVFGLGYVGVVNMACLSKLGNNIFGCDIKSQKVESINKGQSPIYEPQVDDLIAAGLAEGRINASSNAAEALRETQIALVCVGTPSRSDGTVNLDFTINTAHEIANYLKANPKKYTIVFRSTIPPGTIENFLLPEIQKILGDNQELVTVAFLPEFLREGSAVNDFFNCSRIVIGCNEKAPDDLVSLFSYSDKIPVVLTNIRTAEFVKYVDNAFHALKIAFANEAYQIGSAYGADIELANKIFLMDTHLNISEYYLRPGLPFGGSCLPKDMRAINHLARMKNMEVPLLESILPSNNRLQNELFQRIMSTGKQHILLYGLTFKSGTDDVRESPMLHLAKQLSKENVNLKIIDPDINLTTLRIEQADIVKYVANEEAIAEAEVLVVCKKGFASLVHLAKDSAQILNFFNQEKFEFKGRQTTLY